MDACSNVATWYLCEGPFPLCSSTASYVTWIMWYGHWLGSHSFAQAGLSSWATLQGCCYGPPNYVSLILLMFIQERDPSDFEAREACPFNTFLLYLHNNNNKIFNSANKELQNVLPPLNSSQKKKNPSAWHLPPEVLQFPEQQWQENTMWFTGCKCLGLGRAWENKPQLPWWYLHSPWERMEGKSERGCLCHGE